MHIPRKILDRRRDLSRRYIAGDGVELGALHHPLWISDRARVRYVDRLAVPDLRLQYPELKDFDLVEVDVVDDGETLGSFPDDGLDFVIANHMLEHTENPLGTVRNHLRKIRREGILYYAVPDKRYSFDVDRAVTSFDHLVKDDREGPHGSRLDHFREWGRLVNKVGEPAALEEHVAALMQMNYSIHFHVWDFKAFKAFVAQAGAYLGGTFRVKHFGRNDTEIVVILEKL